MPRISVIIPTFNHGEFVAETLESVFAQTYGDFEVIVVNDGSRDDTESVLRPYIEAQRIRYLRQENQGVAAARNAGLALATGEWIAFLDDDDLWLTDKLEWQVACLEASNAVVVGGSCSRFGLTEERKEKGDSHKIEFLATADLFRGNPFGSPGQTLIRKSALEQIGGLDAAIWGVDDLDLWIRLSRIGAVQRVDRVALHYRVHDSNASLDLRRMTQNMEAVILKNIGGFSGAEQKSLKYHGYRSIFRTGGKKLIWKGAALLWQGRCNEGWEMIRFSLSIFLPRIPEDPMLLPLLAMAILKAPWRMPRRK
jgi:glycosyltransferase involved in cell wall biosynthesis